MPDAKEGKILLKLARDAIAEQFGSSLQPAPGAHWLAEPGATFVTLTQQDALRGCIGSLQAYRPLLQDVRANAVAAAFHDPRFAPLRESEFAQTTIEVSLLSPSLAMTFDSESDALAQLRTGIDGVIFECAHHRSTFLPQVWEQLPTAATFMAQLKRKAGLPGDFWAPNVKLASYSVQKWKEAEPLSVENKCAPTMHFAQG